MPTGRPNGFRHNEDTRKKIKAQLIINRLTDHFVSDKPLLDNSQVNAAKALLNKVLPDLKAIEHSAQEGALVMPATVLVAAPDLDENGRAADRDTA